jgi:hypothetical protein
MAFAKGTEDERKLKNLLMSETVPGDIKAPEVLKWFPAQKRFTMEQV